MALKKGATPPSLDGKIEEVPDEIPRGRGGRPKIRALVDGVESTSLYETYTRASTLGKTLENDHAIQQWARRMIVHGLSRRHDLVMRAAAIPGVTEKADKDALAEVAEAALEAAKATAGATKGTALHALSEREDAGESMEWLPPDVREALAAYRRLMSSVRVVASETFVVCDALCAAGTFDRVVELLHDVALPDGTVLPAGTRVVVDLKTNKDANYFGPTYSCQQAVYGHGVPYTHANGRGTWPGDIAPSREWALILHVPLESPVDAGFYWVDLRAGLELAELANLVRSQTGRDDLFHPAELAPLPAPVAEVVAEPASAAPAPDRNDPTQAQIDAAKAAPEPVIPGANTKPVPLQVRRALLMAELRQAPDEDALTALWEASDEAVWQPEHTHVVKARLAELAGAADGAAVPA